MSYLVVGKKWGNFKNDKGEQVSFSQLHCVGDFDVDNNVDGQEAVVFKKADEHFFDSVEVGNDVEILFDRFGKVKKVEVVSQ